VEHLHGPRPPRQAARGSLEGHWTTEQTLDDANERLLEAMK